MVLIIYEGVGVEVPSLYSPAVTNPSAGSINLSSPTGTVNELHLGHGSGLPCQAAVGPTLHI